MKRDNPIIAYYQQIKSGKVIVGQWIELVYAYLVQGFEKKLFFYDNKAANNAIDWVEAHCFHTEGPLAPGNLKLELWQKAILAAIFGIKDEKGDRQFSEIVLIIGRKQGKSLLAAAICRYIWLVDGGFGSRVYCMAPKLDQADLVYNNIWVMEKLDPEYIDRKAEIDASREQKKKGIDDSDLPRHRMGDLYRPSTNSMVKKLAMASKKSDGFGASLAICDEFGSWEGDKSLKQYEVMKSGQGARNDGRMFACSTAGYVSEGIYDELMKRSTRLLLGDSKEKRLLPILYMIDDIEKWNDINELYKSLPNLGVSVSVDYMLNEVEIAEGSLSKKAEFITKYCNIKQNSSLAWLPTQVVDKACGEELTLEDFRGSYCVGGIDLSQTTDLTACCVVIERDGELYVISKAFLPAEKIDTATERDGLPYNAYIKRGLLSISGDNFIDYHDCFNWFRELVEKYEIYPLQVGYDRYSAQYLVQDMERYGFHMDDVYQGDNLYPVLMEIEGLLGDGRIHIGDNDLMKVHLLNSALKMNTERGRGRLVKINQYSHIDLVAAFADAMTVRQKWYAEIGEQLKNGD